VNDLSKPSHASRSLAGANSAGSFVLSASLRLGSFSVLVSFFTAETQSSEQAHDHVTSTAGPCGYCTVGNRKLGSSSLSLVRWDASNIDIMTTSLIAAVVGGWAMILIGLGLAWMAFWSWIYVRTDGKPGD